MSSVQPGHVRDARVRSCSRRTRRAGSSRPATLGQFGTDWFDLLTWLPFNFVLKRAESEVGKYKRILGTVRDRYVLELEPGLDDVDRRLLVAFTVALDALQDR